MAPLAASVVCCTPPTTSSTNAMVLPGSSTAAVATPAAVVAVPWTAPQRPSTPVLMRPGNAAMSAAVRTAESAMRSVFSATWPGSSTSAVIVRCIESIALVMLDETLLGVCIALAAMRSELATVCWKPEATLPGKFAMLVAKSCSVATLLSAVAFSCTGSLKIPFEVACTAPAVLSRELPIAFVVAVSLAGRAAAAVVKFRTAWIRESMRSDFRRPGRLETPS
mmetsp:Transcript_83730/g.232065  ORF Transcript_83730/g.232065 Transcript_83730/m.232065 type:complete len:223 (-) Transcript_83730:307-975(-)